MPNVQKNYERYHAQGFEVLGISLDDEKEAVDQFYKSRKIPWPTLFGLNAEGQPPMAERYGITAIPVALLVGRDGKVVSISVRGEALEEQLKKLLAPSKTADSDQRNLR
jgi:hypothetical protein